MRKRLLAAAIALVLLVCAGTGTWAYFTGEGVATNIVKTGAIGVNIVENSTDTRDGVFIDVSGVMPGVAVSKIIKLENTGSGSAWMRVKLEVTVTLADGKTLSDGTTVIVPLTHCQVILGNGKQSLVFDNGKTTIDPDYVSVAVTLDKGIDANWSVNVDGWCYYLTPVGIGDITSAFTESVTLDSSVGNDYQGCTITITVTAQAVQSANNPIPEGLKDLENNTPYSVADVNGWPAD